MSTRGGLRKHVERQLFYPRWESIRHYYGDTVREFFLGAAALILFAAPFYTDNLNLELPFIVFGAVAIVCLAAVTNPWNRLVMTLNAIVAGVGLVLYESWALLQYQSQDAIVFVLREAPAIIFLFALYFSLKTLRAMMMGLIDKELETTEFVEEAPFQPVERHSHVTQGNISQPEVREDAEEEPAPKTGDEEEEEEDDDDEVVEDALGEPAAEEDDKGGD